MYIAVFKQNNGFLLLLQVFIIANIRIFITCEKSIKIYE